MKKSYSELIKIKSFEDRVEYLLIDSTVGESTFGHSRYINQALYKSEEWKRTRRNIIIRDNGNDLGVEGREILDRVLVHHINPISLDDILERRPCVFDPENLITTRLKTHNIVHYSDMDGLESDEFIERKPNDTTLWK